MHPDFETHPIFGKFTTLNKCLYNYPEMHSKYTHLR